ncbi:ABC transporter permease [Candidatus Woesearchaeota archaeon]|nr:ABC transporter permease [Candidatus Woesearchaeota archaeon]
MIREFFRMLGKDFRLLSRDKKTFMLITVVPLIIMAILASVFSTGTSEALKGIPVIVCTNGNNVSLNIEIFDEVYLAYQNCEINAKNFVASGKFKAAIIIPPNFDSDIKEGKGVKIRAYIDNSKAQTSIVTADAIGAYVQQANEKIGIEFINEAWENLRQLDSELEDVQGKLAVGIKYSADISEKVDSAMSLANDIELPESDIGLISEKLDNISKQISDFNLSLQNQILFEELYSQISSIPKVSEQAENLVIAFNLICSENISEECIALNSTLESFMQVSEEVDARIENLSKQAVLLLNNSISYNEELISLNDSLLLLYENLENSSSELKILQQKFENLSEAKQEYYDKLVELNETTSNLTSDLVTLNSNLNQTRNVLKEYTSRDPQNVVRPVAYEQIKMFADKKYIYFLAPALLSVILLFIISLISSSNIVQERKSGTMVRNVLSPAPLILFIFEKLLFFVILSVIQIAIMLLVLAFFNVEFPITSATVAVLLIASVVFTAIGLVIGTISKSENMAVLMSLVLAIPMLFLSGTFFAFEIMPSFMQAVGKVLPLTVVIESLEGVIIYNLQLASYNILYLSLVSVILFGIAVLLIKKERVIE